MSSSQPDPLLDFRNFLWLIWRHLRLPPPTKRQYAMARYAQKGPRRRGIKAFRGAAKSWITAAYVLWCLYCDPQKNILVVSASKQRADDFTTFCLQLINEVEQLRHLKPRTEQRQSKEKFDVGPAESDQNPSLKSAGITGQITGSRAHLIIADDVETADNANTPAMREKLLEKVKEFDSILLPGGEVMFLGTPQTEESIYNEMAKRGYAFRVWPVRYPTEEQAKAYGDTLAPDIVEEMKNGAKPGESTEPTRFTFLDLAEREASIGRSTFQLQFMLDTSLADANRYPLKLADLLFYACTADEAPEKLIWAASPEWQITDKPMVGLSGDRMYRPVPISNPMYLPYSGAVMAIDPAGRGKDETGYAVVAILNGLLYLLEAGGFNDGYSEATLTSLAEIAKRWKVKKVIAEANFGDGMFTQLIKPVLSRVYPVTVCEVKHSKQKELRIIDTLEPVMNQHRLIVNLALLDKDYESVAHLPTEEGYHYRLFHQLTRITKEKGSLARDDRLDALAIAVGYWVEAMAQDVDKQVDRKREQALKKELQRWYSHNTGRTPAKRWSIRR